MPAPQSANRLLPSVGFTLGVALGAAVLFAVHLAAQAQSPALRIVVIQGEAAVNVVQQKTATAPVVEVRDRNNQPVAGAVVRFAIQGGRATFVSGANASALSVTTNAAGQAVAAGLTPTASGTIQIAATASFQGQTAAAVTIAQTNVMTAAQAAAISSAAGTTGTTGTAGTAGTTGTAGAGAGGGAGGGLSATTIGVVGGAAAAGTVVATKILDKPQYNGTFAGTLPMTFSGPGGCTRNETHTGTIGMDITETNGTITGKGELHADVTVTPGTCPPNAAPNNGTDNFGTNNIQVTGTRDNLSATGTEEFDYTDPGGFSGTVFYTFSFVGTFNGTEITGALTISRIITPSGSGTVVDAVTLR